MNVKRLSFIVVLWFVALFGGAQALTVSQVEADNVVEEIALIAPIEPKTSLQEGWLTMEAAFLKWITAQAIQSPYWEQIININDPHPTFERTGTANWVTPTNYCSAPTYPVLNMRTRWVGYSGDYDWARWRPNLPSAGNYRVEVYLPNAPGSTTNSTMVRYTVHHAGGSNTTVVNQTQNQCGWTVLGTYSFNAGTSGHVYMGDWTGDNPYRIISASAVRFVQVGTPPPPPPPGPIVFSGNTSSRLFVDNNGDRINLEICANNLPGQTVKAYLSRETPGLNYPIVSQVATGRCVTFWDMDGPGALVRNTHYTTRAALNQDPNPSWPGPACLAVTGGQGSCDQMFLSGASNGYKLPYPGGTAYRLSRNRHPHPNGTPAYDFVMPRNSAIVAARAGEVIIVKQDSTVHGCDKPVNTANYIYIRHSDGTTALYSHLKKNGVVVSRGQIVQRGQLLGYTGLSGRMCGNPPDHLHFEVLVGGIHGTRTIVRFEDLNNAEPSVGPHHTSGNYLGALFDVMSDGWRLADALPEGLVQFRLNSNPASNEIKLLAYDYLDEITQMRLATSEAGLELAPWIPYADTATWTDNVVFAQYHTADGRISTVYSDTIAPTANTPIVANFELGSAQVCVGEDIQITNNTMPYCPQCSWNWDLANGTTTQSLNPVSDEQGAWWEYDVIGGYFDPELSYDTAGTYTVTVTVENQNNTSTASHQLTVIDSISADFTIVRSGNTVTVTALADNATSWEWEFADGVTATGQTASHTYDNLDEPQLIVLRTQAANGCSGEAYQFVHNYHIYLPFLVR